MDWKRAIAEERAALHRIVALLLSLANLAETASSRSSPIRGFVLWVLFHAEAVARDLVSGTLAPDVDQAGDGRADATRLAARFRELASELDRQAEQAFAVCTGDRCHNQPALFGLRRLLRLGRAISIANMLPFPTPAENTARLAALPDTS